jgi:putative ABC transport system permease protein
VRGGFGSASTLTVADAAALSSPVAAPDIAGVAPVKTTSESLVYGSTNWTTSVVGTTPDWLAVRARAVTEGRFLSTADQAESAAVTVLGPTTAQELFGATDPVGQSVTINGIPFSVIGVLNSAGSDSTSNLDDQALVPISTAASRLVGGSTRNSVSSIYLAARSSSVLSAAYQEADSQLLSLHHASLPTNADFTITSQQSLITTATSVSRTLTILLAGVAALSLLVGGIGVMNIMLVSVTERTREIGVRKALGATRRDILWQFLTEAMTLTGAGGIIGIVIGGVAAALINTFSPFPAVVQPTWVIIAFAVSMIVGLTFGLWPAAKAARLDPIEALRYE